MKFGLELGIASLLVLFLELVLIRWLPTQVQVVAYFPNLVLIAAFLGLGIGAIRSDRRSLLPFWPACLLLLVVVTTLLGGVAFTARGVTEHLWLLYRDLPQGAPVVEGIQYPLMVLFALVTLCFVPLGQYLGYRLEIFRRHSSPLFGYSIDLGGSALGVTAFTVLSFKGTFPVTWFVGVFVLGVFLMRRHRWPIVTGYLIAAALSVYAVDRAERAERYSPYYALKIQDVIGSTEKLLLTNGSLHQMVMAIQYSGPPSADSTGRVRAGYHLPYDVLDGDPGSVLILGAGTGNDVAVALEEGATRVDAVEIDPVILEYGEELHPNHPYADERVTSFVTDARSFLNDSDESYDLVVFGTLDSQTKLSALSSVRLDNFVYTREGLEAAARRLSPGGGMVLYFMVGDDFIAEHIVAMLTVVFGQPPTVLRGGWNMFNHIFLSGPAFAQVGPGVEGATLDAALVSQIPVPSDDWPYLYLPSRGLTPFYWSLLLSLGGLAVLAVLLSSREMRAVVRERRGGDWEMFLYGLGFLLVEARLVNAINLAWGATWLTSAVVFGSVLVALLIVTVLMELRPIPWRVAAIGLVVSLGVTYLLPVSALVASHGATRLLLSALYVGTPVVFAAACFAIRFKTRPNSSVAFGWNLLGAVLGGLLEFLAMDFGLRAMVLVALAAYVVAILLGERSGAAAANGVQTPAPPST